MRTRVLVSGSRSWRKNSLISQIMTDVNKRYTDLTLVVGDAKGVDRVAAQIATRLGWQVEVHRANWTKNKKAAGMIRNQEMVQSRVVLGLFFIRKDSPGTTGCLKLAIRDGVPAYVWRDDE